jgi:stalled ribosome rescue protein Dom34
MKKIGIWLDKEQAHIVTLEKENETMGTIKSEIEDFHPSGGFGLGYRGSPQDALPEDKYLEREIHQMKAYFKKIVSEIQDADAIVLFGPAQTGYKFKNELEEHFKDINAKVIGIHKTDSMTKNQIKAWVKDYFGIAMRKKPV